MYMYVCMYIYIYIYIYIHTHIYLFIFCELRCCRCPLLRDWDSHQATPDTVH